jgi:putative peptidoglycan lipid II flippase
MFLKAGVLSLALLLASRLLGLLRESAQAAAFGASGLGDVVVLMLTLPDWLTGVLVSGALGYVLVPAWAGRSAAEVAGMERKVARVLLAAGGLMAVAIAILRQPIAGALAAGLPPSMLPSAGEALAWSALAFPAALLAALWTTRLQHERDFTGMYSANLVVNAVLIAAIALVASRSTVGSAILWLGIGLTAAMLLRLGWLRWRAPRAATDLAPNDASAQPLPLPQASVWLWAALAAGLPLALPFAARSVASTSGEGALATFNYAWKLVELPLILAIQLVATLAFPAIARAMAANDPEARASAVRTAFALAWALACAAAAALWVGSPAIAQLLFGWGRMDPEALSRVANWGAVGAWSLLPQALIAVSLTVLAARKRMHAAVWAYFAALGVLLASVLFGLTGGGTLMILLDVVLAGVAAMVIFAIGSEARAWLPWRSMAISLAALLALVGATSLQAGISAWPGLWPGLIAALVAAVAVLAITWWGSADVRTALAR